MRRGLGPGERRPRAGTSGDETGGGTTHDEAPAPVPQEGARVGERGSAVRRSEVGNRTAAKPIEAATGAYPHASFAIDEQAGNLIAGEPVALVESLDLACMPTEYAASSANPVT